MVVTILLPFIFLLLIGLFQNKEKSYGDMTFMSVERTNILRGIAIILVMMMHASCDAGERVFTPMGGIGVSIFLILSGYGLSVSCQKNGIKHFWKKKVVRIYIPYALLLFSIIIIQSNYSRLLKLDFILDLLCLKTSYWYISFLIYNYILYWVCCLLRVSLKVRYLLFMLFAIGLILFDNRIRAEQSLSFVTGMFIADYKMVAMKLISTKNNRVIWAIFVLASCTLTIKQISIVRSIMENITILNNMMELCIKYGFAIIIIALINVVATRNLHLLRNSGFLQFCSGASLEIYLVHFSLRFMIDKEQQTVSLILFLLLTFSISYIFNRINKTITIWIK